MKFRLKIAIICLFCLVLTACDNGDHFAPVADISSIESIPNTGIHRVMRGETLYAIAWRYGLDYRYLASLNQIEPPYKIRANQGIHLRSYQPTKLNRVPIVASITPKPLPQKIVVHAIQSKEPNYAISKWIWPAQGKIINYFSPSNKGVNIAGGMGEPIYATGSGKVVYAGNRLRGYGNLIIIKHNSLYLSAYAHNDRVFVKDGDWVKQGQKIAEMGSTGTNKIMLHFEIRRAGKPLDPIVLYQGRYSI